MAGIVVLDAGALIALLEGKDTHHEWALQLFIDTVGDELVMSALTYAEVLVHPTQHGVVEEFSQAVSGLALTIHPIRAEDSLSLAQRRASSGLRMPDAIVLSLALHLEGTMATTDRVLAERGKALGIDVLSPFA